MEQIWNENDERLLRFVFKIWRFTVSRCFWKVRDDSLKNYGFCTSYYLSAPALSWDAMLNMTKIKLQLISDPDIYIFFEKGMRGGISCISNRDSKAKK